MDIVDRHGPGDCSKCPTKGICVVLCSKAEAVVNQDEVKQRELTIGLTKLDDELDHIAIWSSVYLTKTERKIVTLLGYGLERRDICELLKITREALRKHIERLRKKCHDSYP